MTASLPVFLLARFGEDEEDFSTFGRDRGWDDEFTDRLLADVKAKRRIVALHDVVDAAGGCGFCGEPAPCEHLRLLALPYADHPDYRAEWKP